MINQLKMLLIEKEEKQCSFKPAINQMHSKSPNILPIYERLAQSNRILNISSLQTVKEQKQEKQFKEDCTFYPQINKACSEKSRYLEASKEKYSQAIVSELSKPCTFRPATNQQRMTSDNLNSYLQQNAFERLYAPMPYSLELVKKYVDEKESVVKKEKLNEATSLNPGPFYIEQEFLQRQELYENYKAEKSSKLADDIAKNTEPKSFINMKSVMILKNTNTKERPSKVNINQSSFQEYTFHPKISTLAQPIK